MFTQLPPALIKLLEDGQVLPVVSWGTLGFVESTGLGTTGRERWEGLQNLRNWLVKIRPHLQQLYETIAALPVNCVISFTPDPWFGQLLRYRNSEWVMLNASQVGYPHGRRLLLPLGGNLEDEETVVLFAHEYLDLERRYPILWEHAQSHAARMPLLVLGCDPADKVLRYVLSKLRPSPIFTPAGWLLCSLASARDHEMWEESGFYVVEGQPTILLSDLVKVASRTPTTLTKQESLVKSPVVHRDLVEVTGRVPTTLGNSLRLLLRRPTPYKHLDYFERDEAGIFFGREAEQQRLVDLVYAHRLVVVTGPSGTGKTSLLNAGLLASMDQNPSHVGVYVRCGNDPVSAIQDALSRRLQLSLADRGYGGSLSAFLSRARDIAHALPVVVIDQAEELFTRLGEALRDELLLAVRDCLTATPLVTRFVFSLREDYLVRLAELRDTIPTLLQNAFYLSPLSREGAIAAIRKPAELFKLSFEESLANDILDDIGTGRIAPPQIQIVCSRLFAQCGGKTIDRALYERLGGAKEILNRFLVEELQGMGKEEQAAREILKALVTSEGTKDVLSAKEIARRSKLSDETTHKLLFHLRDHSRLLRSVYDGSEQRFELAHEYLTQGIWSWMSEEEVKRREINELLTREIRSWQRFHHLRLGLDRLQKFESQQALIEADEDALVLLLLSAVKHQRPFESWAVQIKDLGPDTEDRVASQLFDYFQDKDRLQRCEAAEAIARIDPAPLKRALRSTDILKRKAALEMVGGLELEDAVPDVIPLVDDLDPAIRELACGALGEIQGALATKTLRSLTQHSDRKTAIAAIKALGRTNAADSYGIVRNALCSADPLIIEAGKHAVVFSRTHRLIENLLNDKALPESARDALWSALEQLPEAVGRQWVKTSIRTVQKGELSRVQKLLSDGSWLSNLLQDHLLPAPSSSSVSSRPSRFLPKECSAAEAADFLASLDASDQDAVAQDLAKRGPQVFDMIASLLLDRRPIVRARAVVILYCMQSPGTMLEQLLDTALIDADWDVRCQACRAAARHKYIEAVLQLLQDLDARVRAEALRELADLPLSSIDPSARLLADALTGNDATVRYWACLAAAKHHLTKALEAIRPLVDDIEKVRDWQKNEKIGSTVRDAANYALDTLNPLSKVWRKPFQRSFRKGLG